MTAVTTYTDSAPKREDRRQGAILGVVLVVVGLVSFIGVGLLELAARDAEETSRAVINTRAFWLAEAGMQRITKRLFDQLSGDVATTDFGYGNYQVWLYDKAIIPYAVALGQSGSSKRYIRANLIYLGGPFETAVFGANEAGGEWVLDLRGIGDPVQSGPDEVGGRDIINGNVFVAGDFFMTEESEVNALPSPNSRERNGDVEATGTITVDGGDASIEGDQFPGAAPRGSPNLNAMDYANNHTYNISKIFNDLGISTGYLPEGHPLRDVVQKNPANRGAECATTPGDDFFFEPVKTTAAGKPYEARTPLDLGPGRVYYVEGDSWFHSYGTYGFKVSGQATIVTTGDMHVSDNIKYKDSNSLLGLVALGEYDAVGDLYQGGDLYFGDPQFNQLYAVDAFMFAGHDFLYNHDAGGGQARPRNGFEVFGNFVANNDVVVHRDWYDPDGSGIWRPTVYDHATGKWRDALITDPNDPDYFLAEDEANDEVSTIKHYQMKVTYDERVWSSVTQPPGLPRGAGTIYGGMYAWQEVTAGDL